MSQTSHVSLDVPVRDEYLVFGSPQLLDAEIEEVVAALRSGWIGTGPRVAAFENAFREYVGAAHARRAPLVHGRPPPLR